MSAGNDRTVFVYGSLKRGGSNHALLAHQQFLGPACTGPGFTLFGLDGYPGMVRDPADADGVTGELWLVDEPCLAKLDRLEGVDEGLYERVEIALTAPPDAGRAQVYLYLRPIDGRRRIGSTWPV